MQITTDGWLELPIGIKHEGKLFKKVRISKSCLLDMKIATNPQYKDNGGKTLLAQLSRCIQEVDGLLPAKTSVDARIPENTKWLREMYLEDAVYIIMQRDFMSDPFEKEQGVEYTCPNCGNEDVHVLLLEDVPVYFAEDATTPNEVYNEFTLEDPVEITRGSGTVKLVSGFTMPMNLDTHIRLMSSASSEEQRSAFSVALACAKFLDSAGKEYTLTEAESNVLSNSNVMTIIQSCTVIPGVKQVITVNCSSCDEEIAQRIQVPNFLSKKESAKTVLTNLDKGMSKFAKK